MSIQIVKVPDIGGDDVEVIEVCVEVGDMVAVEDSLVVLESDKASMEVPSPLAGRVKSITLAEGDNVSEGAVILELDVVAEPTIETADQPQFSEDSKPEVLEVVEEVVSEHNIGVEADKTIETILVPDIGADEADVIEICVAVGDDINEGDSIIVLETDKASMEVPSPQSGKIVSLAIHEGDKASEGMVILALEIEASIAVAEAVPAKADIVVLSPAADQIASSVEEIIAIQPAQSETSEFVGDALYAGPAVRKIMREFGVDGLQVKGTGPKGRILKQDIQAFVKDSLSNKAPLLSGGSGIPLVPAMDFSQFGDIDIQPRSKIAKVTAANMQRNWLNVPHVTQFDDADITDLEAFRKDLKAEAEKRGVKITPLAFLLKACAKALLANPVFNSSLDETGDNLVLKNYVHIGMAVDTSVGLMVPVIRDVDKKSIWDLAAETAELGTKAKNRKLRPAEMQGGCFTISSLGNIGGMGFTPIVNAPEVAILGVSKLAVKPLWNGSEFVPRKMLPLAISYDHRVVNGADAGRFFACLTALLSDIRRFAL